MSKTENKMEKQNQKSAGPQAIQIAQLVGEILLVLVKYIYFYIESIYRLLVPATEVSVRGEIVLVTGAGHGIGKQLALQYAAQGATVVAWDVNAKNNDETVDLIKKMGNPTAYAYICDVSNREAVFQTVAKVKKDVGDISIIVNNAGIMPTHTLLDHTQQEIEKIFGINVFAHFWIIQAILPTMIKNKHGHIVALSSMAGLIGFENLVPYCASKFAVTGLMESLYQEIKLYPGCNVKLTVICPYLVDTGLCKNPRMRFEGSMPMLTPEEVAKQIVSAQRRGVKLTTLPGYLFYLNNVLRTGPVKGGDIIKDFMDTGLDSDLK